jgi:hypothetical protein
MLPGGWKGEHVQTCHTLLSFASFVPQKGRHAYEDEDDEEEAHVRPVTAAPRRTGGRHAELDVHEEEEEEERTWRSEKHRRGRNEGSDGEEERGRSQRRKRGAKERCVGKWEEGLGERGDMNEWRKRREANVSVPPRGRAHSRM